MSFEFEGAYSGFLEGDPGVTQYERARLMQELAEGAAEAARLAIEGEINRDPLLQKMFYVLLEVGPELDPALKNHLRRMIALRLQALFKEQEGAMVDSEAFALEVDMVAGELAELEALLEGEELPDEWDIALKDLLELDDDA